MAVKCRFIGGMRPFFPNFKCFFFLFLLFYLVIVNNFLEMDFIFGFGVALLAGCRFFMLRKCRFIGGMSFFSKFWCRFIGGMSRFFAMLG